MEVTTYEIKDKKVPERREIVKQIQEKNLEVIVVERSDERFTRGFVSDTQDGYYVVKTISGQEVKIEYRNMKVLYSTNNKQ